MSGERPITSEAIAVLLAPALGQDKSEEVVASTSKALSITRAAYTREDIRAIFDKLVKAEGLVGVVARFAVSRGDVDRLIARAPRSAPKAVARPTSRVGAPASPSPSVPPARFDIMPLIAPALGAEKARDAIEAAAARRGVDVATGLSYDGALAVLDEMTKVDGIVGVVARFAKARFLLDPDG